MYLFDSCVHLDMKVWHCLYHWWESLPRILHTLSNLTCELAWFEAWLDETYRVMFLLAMPRRIPRMTTIPNNSHSRLNLILSAQAQWCPAPPQLHRHLQQHNKHHKHIKTISGMPAKLSILSICFCVNNEHPDSETFLQSGIGQHCYYYVEVGRKFMKKKK